MKFTLNMASRRYINRRLLNRFFLVVILGLSLSLLAIFVHGVRLAGYAGQFHGHLAELRAGEGGDVAEEEKPPAPAEMAQLRKELTFAREILKQDQLRWTVLLNRLEGLAIEGIRIRTMEPDYSKGSLGLTALARDDQKLRDFLDRLLVSEEFPEVYLLEQGIVQVKDANDRQQTAVNFRIVLKGAF